MLVSSGTPGSTTIRTEVWSKRVQEELQEMLMAQQLVEFISGEFADGEKITMPTLGSMQVRDYTENADITIDDPSVGEFALTIDKYYQCGIGLTDKLKQDTYYMEILIQKFPEQMIRAIMEKLETDIFALHTEQTESGANLINGASHRMVGSGTGQAITLDDVAYAKYALDKANVPKNGRKAIIDPLVSYQLINVDNVIRQDVYGANTNLKEGFGGSEYIGKYLGFDFYESNLLDSGLAETVTDGTNGRGGTVTAGIANLFLGPEVFMGAIREMPDIEFIRQGERKRDVYHATSRWGLGLYRPECLVTLITE